MTAEEETAALLSRWQPKTRSLKAAATKPEASVAATFRSRDEEESKISQYQGGYYLELVVGKAYIWRLNVKRKPRSFAGRRGKALGAKNPITYCIIT